uniref:Uncharacterized protein n=1 Tax=Anguilla anguilla TaxID=7936 RepID=A0A0E9UGE0_ANGAN
MTGGKQQQALNSNNDYKNIITAQRR